MKDYNLLYIVLGLTFLLITNIGFGQSSGQIQPAASSDFEAIYGRVWGSDGAPGVDASSSMEDEIQGGSSRKMKIAIIVIAGSYLLVFNVIGFGCCYYCTHVLRKRRGRKPVSKLIGHLVTESSGQQHRIKLHNNKAVKIGRADDNNIILNDRYVSKHHAQLWFSKNDNSMVVTDNNSKNHTYVNGKKIVESFLTFGDEIRIHKTRFVFEEPR